MPAPKRAWRYRAHANPDFCSLARKTSLPCGSAAAVGRACEPYGWRPHRILLSYSTEP
ncbi:hypothetical protein DA2_1792 [Desulfovibrio sp. A2]|nr:hypothetical protein DA2_1792 [Desulfovibrio sp. A2]